MAGVQGTPESEAGSFECFQNYTAPEVFIQGLAGIVDQQDVESMIRAQKQMWVVLFIIASRFGLFGRFACRRGVMLRNENIKSHSESLCCCVIDERKLWIYSNKGPCVNEGLWLLPAGCRGLRKPTKCWRIVISCLWIDWRALIASSRSTRHCW